MRCQECQAAVSVDEGKCQNLENSDIPDESPTGKDRRSSREKAKPQREGKAFYQTGGQLTGNDGKRSLISSKAGH